MKVSVITVCLNSGKYIVQALKSVAEQSQKDLEHIVVDGGSTDDTQIIIQSAAKYSPKLRWISAPDNGISDAMNKGLALATGDIIAFLHADDFYVDKDVLKRVADVFAESPHTEWLSGGMFFVNDAGQSLKFFSPRRWSYQRLLRGNILFHPATFVRSQALRSVGGFDNRLRYTMDYDLWLRLGTRSAPYLMNQPLACFRIHEDSTSVKHVDAAFKEEFHVRCRYLHGKRLQRILHLFYFYVKYLPNRMRYRDAN